jgi:hypothetical protein
MNQRFSQRIGRNPLKTLVQIDDIDIPLKNRLWNVILESFFSDMSEDLRYGESQKGEAFKLIWKEFFGNPVDKIPSYSNANYVNNDGFVKFLRNWFFYSAPWYEIYDLMEFFVDETDLPISDYFTQEINKALEKEVSGFRIVDKRIVQITSELEIQEIEDAISQSKNWKSVNTHLLTALDFLSDRQNPDYRNSIKESISSVESLCKIITQDNNATLGKALAEIEKNHELHGALKSAFSALYGYSSDAGGIRHSLLEEDILIEFEDAKFILVSCSAFINYLKGKLQI